MRKLARGALLAVSLYLAALLLVIPVSAAEPTPYIAVTLYRGADQASALALFDSLHLTVDEHIEPLPVYRLATPSGANVPELLDQLRRDRLVRAAEIDGEQRAALIPNDPRYLPIQWNLRRIAVDQLWDLRPTAPDLIVAVLDSGVDATHPDLRQNLLLARAFDFTTDQPGAPDDLSHGTGVAGVIGAVGDNGEGIAGIAWRVRILPIKVLNSQGRGSNAMLAKAIVYASDQGARIINISSTGDEYSTPLEEAAQYAIDRGALIVAASSNTDASAVVYPAALRGVLAVGSVDEQDRPLPSVRFASYVGILAPGADVTSTAWSGGGSQYSVFSGSSIASPQVAGVAALLSAARPDLPMSRIAEVLRSTADPAQGIPASGPGIVNAARAMRALRLGPAPSPVRASAPAAVAPPAPSPLPAAATRWYFAEGSTQAPFDAQFAVLNPNSTAADVRFTFLSPEGSRSLATLQVPAKGRSTLDVDATLGSVEFSAIVESADPVFVERTMFFGHDGHTAAGAREAARLWHLAEGSTVAPFDTWMLLMNPNPVSNRVTLRFMREDGTTVDYTEVLPPSSRRSIYVNQLLVASGFSTTIEGDQPIVVERGMYFDGGAGGDVVPGTRVPMRSWWFAEGNSRAGTDTWLLLGNPSLGPAQVRMTFYKEDGTTVSHPMLIPPQTRASLLTNLVIPDAVYGMRVEADQAIVAERAVYLDGSRAAYQAAGTASPASEWFFAEGMTTGSFVEQIALLNPSAQPANVQLDYARQDGKPVPPQIVRIEPFAHRTIDVNAVVVDGQAGVHLYADRPVVAERILYFARPSGLGATSAAGQTR